MWESLETTYGNQALKGLEDTLKHKTKQLEKMQKDTKAQLKVAEQQEEYVKVNAAEEQEWKDKL